MPFAVVPGCFVLQQSFQMRLTSADGMRCINVLQLLRFGARCVQ
jgi:hypothetical protein